MLKGKWKDKSYKPKYLYLYVGIYLLKLPIQITISQDEIFLTADILLGVSKNKVIWRLDALFVQYVFL